MEVKFVDQMGSDLSVVNAARVSFDKVSEWDYTFSAEDPSLCGYTTLKLKSQDEKLISFLARENHWTPFGHTSLSIHVKAPIFVARQLGKHQVGLVWNEISRRYVDSSPEFYIPESWRKKNPDKKQGSYEDEFVDLSADLDHIVDSIVNLCKTTYNSMLDLGVCAEQARMILPQNMYTEWYWSGSLIAFARVCNLRLKKDTQLETRIIAQQISDIAASCFPISWQYLKKV